MNNVDNQLDATIMAYLTIPVSSTCFGQLFCPKHVELTGIVIKPLLLHLVSCLYYLYFIIFF